MLGEGKVSGKRFHTVLTACHAKDDRMRLRPRQDRSMGGQGFFLMWT